MSVSVKTYDFTMAAGGSVQILAVGTYFRIQTCTGALSITGEFGEASPISAGQGLKDSPFTRLQLKNLTAFANSGTIIVASEEFVDQQMVLSGVVQTSSTPVAGIAYSDVTVVSSAGGSLLLNPRANRRYLLIQNKSTTGSIWISTGGNTPFVGQGIYLPPGGIFEQDNGALIYQFNAIGDIGSNPNVLVMEGW